ncbi:MAG TPA: Gfo/Idh/MocA family oxidoreductase [Armatimonadota bacterium]|nr:Gfo/Idh/MocA family oxidoreductase [Armatimonadota bacterium]
MALRVAFAGLKHDHVRTILRLALDDPGVELAGVADSDLTNREAIAQAFRVPVDYISHEALLESAEFDALVVCDAFGRRGEAAIAALETGKHVFSDKPLCTREVELHRIADLAREKGLEVGVDFSLRHYWAGAKLPLEQGEIGDLLSCTFAGPHALGLGRRPSWYFEPGMHGGIINDLMGHGLDYVGWVTGQRCVEVLSATRVTGLLREHPGFEMLGEAHFRLADGLTAFGHVDYLAPEGHAGGWWLAFTGSEGDALLSEASGLRLRRTGAAETHIAAAELRSASPHPFVDFVGLLTDGTPPLRTTAEALDCSLASLVAQRLAASGEGRGPVDGTEVSGK